MLEIKISELPAATTPLDGTEVFPLVQGVETKKVSIDGLFTQANMGTPASIDLTNATNVPGGGITGTVAIANGGTGATTAAGARTNLGVTATGMDTTYLYRANNLSDLNSASSARTNLGLGSAAVLTAGAANGVATLDSSGTVPLSQIPAALQGALNYQGTWNASTNSPTLTSSVGTKGYYYVVSTAGSTNLNGVSDWQIGDWAVFNGSAWQKIDNTDAVTSVNGYTGTVVLTQTDITGTVPINKGGTGQITQQSAINALAGSLTSGYYLRGNGTNVLMSAIQAADVPTLNQNTTGTASNVTGIVAIANGGTGASTAATARTNLGLGTMATQDATGVAITGGAINGTTVGATTASTGKFTNLEATGTLTGSNGIMAIGTSQIYKDATGNVGFNSIVPSEKIDVVGNIKASGTISAATQFTGPGTGLTGTAASLSIGGNAANVTGTVAIANGGTGQITANAAFNALAPSQTSQSGKYLTTDGTNTSWATNPLGTVTSVSFTGGLISVATSTTTPAFTVAGTSWGIPYFSSASTWASTAAGTTGQVLTATTGSAPTWAAPATSGTVTSVAVSGGTTGLTTSGGPITSSGTITLAGTVATTNGGTGLSSFTANGVVYASSSSVLTTGSTLVFDGTNVGIGTSSPAAKLQVTSSTAGDGIRINGNNFAGINYYGSSVNTTGVFTGLDSGGGFVTNVRDAGYLAWSTTNTERMRIDSSGKVGIGTNNPGAKLTVQLGNIGIDQDGAANQFFGAAGNVAGTNTTGGVLTVFGHAPNAYGDTSVPPYDGTNFVGAAGLMARGFSESSEYRGSLEFFTKTGSTANATSRMIITHDGNVGIGTSSPAKKLDVNGDALINGITVGRGSGAVATNTAVGYQAAFSNTTGLQNLAIGYQAGYSNTVSNYNVAIGSSALYANTGTGNTAGGYNSSSAITTGSYNVGFGYASLNTITTASGVIGIGQGAGSTLTTGSYGTYIGYGATPSSASAGTEILIGGPNFTGKGSSTGFINPNGGGVYQGNNSATWSITSDQRLKKNIVDNNTGLDIINQIQVRNFEYRLPEEVTELPENQTVEKQGVQLGVIAQEFQQVLPDCVKTESTGVMNVNTDSLTWYMINAIKELTTRLTTLEKK